MMAPAMPPPPALSALLAGLPLQDPVPQRWPDGELKGLTLDSRRCQPGWVFLACAGTQQHGIAFAAQAVAAGACAILAEPSPAWPAARLRTQAASLPVPVLLVDDLSAHAGELAARWHGEPSRGLPVIAITGTNGKTSVSHYLAQALSLRGRCCGVIGTLGSGCWPVLETATHTTPDAVQLQQILARLRDAGATAVVMEASSHALAQQRLTATHIDTAVFTNLSRDHLDYHGTMQAYGEAKARLFQWPGLRRAVLPVTDPFGAALADRLAAEVTLLRVGIDLPAAARRGAFVSASQLQLGADGITARVHSDRGHGELHAPLLGRFNLENLLLVLGVLLQQGIALADALACLRELQPVPGRLQPVPGPAGTPRVVVDFAHTPDALQRVLEVLRPLCNARLHCVFGCGGERDPGKRPLMGAIAERLADHVVLTSDNPRGEAPLAIIQAILEGMQAPQRATVEPERGRAIRQAIAAAQPGDTVLLAGKGHERTQQVGAQHLPFSDLDQAQQALQELAA